MKRSTAKYAGRNTFKNPLNAIRLGTDCESQDVQKVVFFLTKETAPKRGRVESADRHWDQFSNMFLAGVILQTMHEEKAADRIATLETVAWRLSSPAGVDDLYVKMKENKFGKGGKPHRLIQGAAIDMLECVSEHRSTILSRAKAKLFPYRVNA